MKIELKTIRLAALAFICGFLFCALLVVISEGPLPQRTTPPVVASGPRLASSQVAAPFTIRLPPDERPRGLIRIERDQLEDAQALPGSRPSRNLDLIDPRPPRIDLKDVQ